MKDRKNSRRLPILPIIAAATALLLVITGVVSAKYTQKQSRSSEIKTSTMYLTSNYLKADTIPEREVSDWSTNGIQFDVYNYNNQNVMDISDIDVKYKVDIETGMPWALESVKDDSGNKQSPDDDGFYTIKYTKTDGYADISKHSVVLKYTGSGISSAEDLEAASPTVTVQGAPYDIVLKGKFKLTVLNLPSVKMSKQSAAQEYYTVEFVSNDYSGEVEVSWKGEATVRPDTNNENMKGWVAGATGSGRFTAKEFTTYTLIFFKTDKDAATEFSIKKVGTK